MGIKTPNIAEDQTGALPITGGNTADPILLTKPDQGLAGCTLSPVGRRRCARFHKLMARRGGGYVVRCDRFIFFLIVLHARINRHD